MPTILAFGYHDRNSPRHRTVCDALTAGGGDVLECHTTARGFFRKWRGLRAKYRAVIAKAIHERPIDVVLVPFPGHFLMPLAWWLTRRPRRRLIFDAFISLHDTEILDRRRWSRWHPWAWILWTVDWLSMHLADEVLIDTEAHRRFLIETFRLKPEHVRVIYLEARKDLFYPHTTRSPLPAPRSFEIFFYGTVIPLQGIDVILDAAAILERENPRARFTMLGPAKLKTMIEARHRTNITYHPPVALEEIPHFIHGADLCLGIFGTSAKVQRVIPHKLVDAVACGVPVLTADTPAIRERFGNHPLVHLIPTGNPQALAEAISKAIRETPLPAPRSSPRASEVGSPLSPL